MPIIYHSGSEDMFNVEGVTQFVNPVNCVGISGAGLALFFKKHFPTNQSAYVKACETGVLKLGEPLCVSTGEILIWNFPTKQHWKDKSKLEPIQRGLVRLASSAKDQGPIAIPALGAGLGGLPWLPVREAIAHSFALWEQDVHIFDPHD